VCVCAKTHRTSLNIIPPSTSAGQLTFLSSFIAFPWTLFVSEVAPDFFSVLFHSPYCPFHTANNSARPSYIFKLCQLESYQPTQPIADRQLAWNNCTLSQQASNILYQLLKSHPAQPPLVDTHSSTSCLTATSYEHQLALIALPKWPI